MNKFITTLIFLFGISGSIFAQVGIGTTTPEASAALDVSSSDKGFLMPRMTTAQREAIVSPVIALKVFDTDTKSEWTYIDGAWTESKAGVGKFIDGASADIAYYPGRVGIGLNTFSTGHKLYVESIKDTDGSHAATVIRGVYNGTGTAVTTYGLGAVARNNSTGTIGYGIGLQGILENPNSGGTVQNGVGSWPQVSNHGDITWASSIVGDVTNNPGGTIGTGRAENLAVYNKSGATMGTASLSSMYMENLGSITGNAYGLWIGGASTGSVDGNAYALYIATPYTNIAGDNFALYSDNTADSYLEGNVGIGTSDPQQKVHINGVLRLEPQGTPPTGNAGDIYAGTDNKLYFHNGTEWKEIQLAP